MGGVKSKKRAFAVENHASCRQIPGVRRSIHAGSLAFLLGLVLVGGCATPSSGHKLAWRTLSRGLTSGLTESRKSVVRSEVEFLKLWAEHAAEVNRPALPPSVDFEREMVLVLAMGRCPTGGYLTEVVDVELRGRTLRVLVGERSPSPGSIQIQRETQPFQFVALPAVSGRVEFRTVREAQKPVRSEQERSETQSRRITPKVQPAVPVTESPRGEAVRQ